MGAHGVSMSTLFRNLEGSGKTFLIVQDTQAKVFGGFAPETWEPRHKFFGTPEAFSFSNTSAEPEADVFTWTSSNNYFMYCDQNLLAMGGGDGLHAIAIRSDLLRGTSAPTSTFGNPTLSASEEFVVRDIEVWALEEVED